MYKRGTPTTVDSIVINQSSTKGSTNREVAKTRKSTQRGAPTVRSPHSREYKSLIITALINYNFKECLCSFSGNNQADQCRAGQLNDWMVSEIFQHEVEN